MSFNIVNIVSRDKSQNSLLAAAAWEFEPTASILEFDSPDEFLSTRNQPLYGQWELLVTDFVELRLPVSRRNLYMPIVTYKMSQDDNVVRDSKRKIDFNSDQPVFLGDIKPHVQEAISAARLFQKLKTNASRMSTLTDRERRVVVLAADGVPNKTIAKRLDVSVKTIEKIRRTAYLKLSVKSSAEVASLVTFDRFIGMNNLLSIPHSPMTM